MLSTTAQPHPTIIIEERCLYVCVFVLTVIPPSPSKNCSGGRPRHITCVICVFIITFHFIFSFKSIFYTFSFYFQILYS